MGKPCFLWPNFIHILFFFFFLHATDTIYGQYCKEDQSSALMHLKQTLNFDPHQSSKLISWNNWSITTDCCSWRGVTCNKNGSIIGLDLNGDGIHGGLDNSRSLFDLQYLKNLSLANNNFHAPIPTSISRLVNLEHLDLSNSGFNGQVPVEISHMNKLLTLDLGYNSLELQRPNLTVLVSNLSQLQMLRLDHIDISYHGREWSNVLSSSLPNLRILSLSNCSLFGTPDVSLLRLKYLSEITLARNNFSAPFPDFFVHFANLKSLILNDCELHGKLPEKLFHLQSLVRLKLSFNHLLHGPLPGFPKNMSLQTLHLTSTNLSGDLPFSIENLTQLQDLDFLYNSLAGTLPPSLFALPFLKQLVLSSNHFSGLLQEFPNASSSPLATILLNDNQLEGPIPMSIYKLQNLSVLNFSFNNFNGTVEVTNLQRLKMLTNLDLSYNSLSFPPSTSNFTLLPLGINNLKLASCNLTVFPNLRNHKNMFDLDLSNNRIQGEIPNWIWNIYNVTYHGTT